jgi:hypothetical protein
MSLIFTELTEVEPDFVPIDEIDNDFWDYMRRYDRGEMGIGKVCPECQGHVVHNVCQSCGKGNLL